VQMRFESAGVTVLRGECSGAGSGSRAISMKNDVNQNCMEFRNSGGWNDGGANL
jgi:hypothetical protein